MCSHDAILAINVIRLATSNLDGIVVKVEFYFLPARLYRPRNLSFMVFPVVFIL